MRGRFITLEGGEGVGKSTQARAIVAMLDQRGVPVVTTREPGGSPNAEALRALLMSGSDDRWSARAEALLFAAARADHVERVIEPALAAGRWVVCDRYLDSSRAYQGGVDAIDDADVIALHRFGSRGLMPDRTLLLTLDPSEGQRRAARRQEDADRFASRNAAALAARFARLAEQDLVRIRCIDASGPAVDVTERALAALADLLP